MQREKEAEITGEVKEMVDNLLEQNSLEDAENLLIEAQIYLNRIKRQNKKDIKLVA